MNSIKNKNLIEIVKEDLGVTLAHEDNTLKIFRENEDDDMDTELLKKVKIGLGITGEYQDETLQIYIDEVKAFMRSAGVLQTVIDSPEAVGVIMRGVADLWRLDSGSATLSEYFVQRVIQLAASTEEAGGDGNV